jgi:hypothetical protein
MSLMVDTSASSVRWPPPTELLVLAATAVGCLLAPDCDWSCCRAAAVTTGSVVVVFVVAVEAVACESVSFFEWSDSESLSLSQS